MTLARIFLICLIAFPVGLHAQAIASKPQAREWTEKSPPQGFTITNYDTYVDYKRDGQIVFRKIERTVALTETKSQRVNKATQHWIEFAADGKVFATVGLGATSRASTLTSGHPVYFASGPQGEDGRFFHVCMPHHNYYEYLEITGTEVKLQPDTPDSYAARKRAFIQMTERGYEHQLGREQLLDAERKQP